jgi:hypothetical protein
MRRLIWIAYPIDDSHTLGSWPVGGGGTLITAGHGSKRGTDYEKVRHPKQAVTGTCAIACPAGDAVIADCTGVRVTAVRSLW